MADLKSCLNEVEQAMKRAARDIPRAKAEERRQFMKAPMPMHGLPVPAQRQLLKKGYSFSAHPPKEQMRVWQHIWRHGPSHESKGQAAYALTRLKPLFEPEAFWDHISSWADHINCWDQADELAKHYSFSLEEGVRTVYPTLKTWNGDTDSWKRRLSIVSLFCYAAIHDKHPALGRVLPLVRALLKDEDYYVQKGVGWTLRETYNVYPEKAFDFVRKNASILHPAAFSAACEKMTAAEKEEIKSLRKGRAKTARS